MTFSVEELTVEDFTASAWREVVDGAEERECNSYQRGFSEKAREAAEAGDAKAENLFGLLRDIASMCIRSDDPTEPLAPMWQRHDQRSAIPSDFDPALPFLADILPHIDDPELKARVGDVVWLRRRDHKAAREAVTAYLAAARLEDGEQWLEAIDRVERATDIAARANQPDLLDTITDRIKDGLAAFNGSEVSYLPARLMALLQQRRAGDPTHYANLSQKFAFAAESRDDWHKAREFWDIKANWHKIAREDDLARDARLRSAETFVSEARTRASGDHPSHVVAVHFLESAIHGLRATGGQQERIKELHRCMLAHQEKAIAEMGVISHPMDVSEMVSAAEKAVSGKTLYDALFALALLGRPPRVEHLREQARRHRDEFVFSHIAPIRTVNAMGRVVARRGPLHTGETEDEAALCAEVYRNANLTRSLHVQGLIEPARAQINREHDVRVADLLRLVQNNPFVPEEREPFYARGLQAGFSGDFPTAAHLLVLQIENSIRYILDQKGIITSGLGAKGIQDELGLNHTLRLPQFTEALTGVLGEDLLFDLRGLLIEGHGANLRNDVAHGLLNYSSFYSEPCVYLWWLTLRLCQQEQEGGGSASAASDGAAGDGEAK